MMVLRVLLVELTKLKGSIVLLLAAAPPAMMAIMIPAVILSGNASDEWQLLALSGTAVWAYLLMPLTITALTALVASLEHQDGGWTWTLAQPCPKPLVFATKALVCSGLMALICIGIGVSILVGGSLAGAISEEAALSGPLPVALLAETLSKMFLASQLVIAIQFAVAHTFRAFAIPIIIGISGTFVAVVATSAQAGIYFPWLLAVNMQASDPGRAMQALLTGVLGGVLVFTVSCIWLARRDWR